MIVCICRRINETGVKAAVAAGARSPEAVQAHHGCAFNCGKCRPQMASLIGEEMDAALDDQPFAAAAE